GLPMIKAIDANTITGYAFMLLYLMTPLQVIMNLMPTLGRANVALKKIEELGLILMTSKVETEERASTPERAGWRCLELLAVTHEYRDEAAESRFMLGPIHLKFHPGEVIFIVGGNGSGKTTLAKLITGLYVPEKGVIELDGEPIVNDNRDNYRQLFSTV